MKLDFMLTRKLQRCCKKYILPVNEYAKNTWGGARVKRKDNYFFVRYRLSYIYFYAENMKNVYGQISSGGIKKDIVSEQYGWENWWNNRYDNRHIMIVKFLGSLVKEIDTIKR